MRPNSATIFLTRGDFSVTGGTTFMTKQTVGASVFPAKRLIFPITCLCALNLFAANPALVTVAASSGGKDIQAALDKPCRIRAGKWCVEPGIYQINRQPLFLRRDGETLRGSGSSTVLHLADKANCPVVILGAPLDLPPMNIAHLRLTEPCRLTATAPNNRWNCGGPQTMCGELENNGVTVWAATDATGGARHLLPLPLGGIGHRERNATAVRAGLHRLRQRVRRPGVLQYGGQHFYAVVPARQSGGGHFVGPVLRE